MKVKKFIAPTMPEAMKQVRKGLGDEAVILNSKEVYTGGFLGLFKKRNIEVVAAIDPQPQPKPKKVAVNTTKSVPTFSSEKKDTQQQVVLEELRSIRKWMEKSSDQAEHTFPAAFESIYDELINQEVNEDIGYAILSEVLTHEDGEFVTYQDAKELILHHIENKLSEFSFGGLGYDKKFVHLVGPTGVGKTTTIAKLAANCLLKDGKTVALITTDTYRIAAIEQLKTYAKILDIPLEIAYTMEDYQKARLKFQSYDIVLVDTAGRNFRDEKYIAELGKVVDLEHDIETYLVLSLTTKAKDLDEIFQQFHNVPLKKLIFTKQDETTTYGSMLNLAFKYKIGIAYLTNGQDVPDNIEEATNRLIAQMVVGEQYNAK